MNVRNDDITAPHVHCTDHVCFVLYNQTHVLHSDRPEIVYALRTRSHNKSLICKSSDLNDRNFSQQKVESEAHGEVTGRSEGLLKVESLEVLAEVTRSEGLAGKEVVSFEVLGEVTRSEGLAGKEVVSFEVRLIVSGHLQVQRVEGREFQI